MSFVWYTRETEQGRIPVGTPDEYRVRSVGRPGSFTERPATDSSPQGRPSTRPNPYEQRGPTSAERKPAVLVRQIMTTEVVTLTPATTLEEAWKLIRDRRFRHVPVISPPKRPVGIVSDRDFLREAASFRSQGSAGSMSRTVQEIMKQRVLTATPDTAIREIARVLLEERIGSMVVVDAEGQIAGIVTRSDILRTVMNHAPLDLWT